jgi:hypothetical protein
MAKFGLFQLNQCLIELIMLQVQKESKLKMIISMNRCNKIKEDCKYRLVMHRNRPV